MSQSIAPAAGIATVEVPLLRRRHKLRGNRRPVKGPRAIGPTKGRSGLRPETRQGALPPGPPAKAAAFAIHPLCLGRGRRDRGRPGLSPSPRRPPGDGGRPARPRSPLLRPKQVKALAGRTALSTSWPDLIRPSSLPPPHQLSNAAPPPAAPLISTSVRAVAGSSTAGAPRDWAARPGWRRPPPSPHPPPPSPRRSLPREPRDQRPAGAP